MYKYFSIVKEDFVFNLYNKRNENFEDAVEEIMISQAKLLIKAESFFVPPGRTFKKKTSKYIKTV